MAAAITDFINIRTFENKKTVFELDDEKRANIYRSLHQLGYRVSTLGRKRIYYQRIGLILKEVRFFEITGAFFALLDSCDFLLNKTVRYDQVINWFYQHCPVKPNGSFVDALSELLSEEEIHTYRIQNDVRYKHRFKVQQLLLKFREWDFDQIHCRPAGSRAARFLHYKNIGANKFLIFEHSNVNTLLENFDSYIAEFRSTKHIGSKQSLSHNPLKDSFDLDSDFHVISPYIIEN